jgi:Cupin domain
MEKNPPVPRQQLNWVSELVEHRLGEDAPFHYHEVEEWLQVQEGKITFFPAGELMGLGAPYPCVQGDVLRIPQGEVHRVEIGSAVVKYQMWTPVPSGSCFQRKIDRDLEELIRRNLQLPGVENRYDERKRNPRDPTPQDQQDDQFLDDFVSEALTMRTAGGGILDRRAYLTRGPAPFTRSPSPSVRILHKTPPRNAPPGAPGTAPPDHESLLLSTVVHTTGGPGGPQQITNLRLFGKEDSRVWKCRVWVNYPEPGAS